MYINIHLTWQLNLNHQHIEKKKQKKENHLPKLSTSKISKAMSKIMPRQTKKGERLSKRDINSREQEIYE